MKVGFIIGPIGPEYQDTYYDKFDINDKRPWLKLVPKEYHIDDEGNPSKRNDPRAFVRIDVAVAYCLRWMYPQHKIDIIPAEKITTARLRKNELVINQFMDLLIVPFMKKYEKNGLPHLKLREIYESNADIIYPPVRYQNLVYNKCAYYKFLGDNGIPVAPTLCLGRDEFQRDPSAAVLRVVEYARSMRWKKIFAKPVHGTDSGDIALIAKDYTITKKTLDDATKETMKYVKSTFANKRYPAIVFQKFLKDFETSVPQLRTYYIGRKYQYGILNTADGTIYRPKSEVTKTYNHEYTMKFRQLKSLQNIAQKVHDLTDAFFEGAPKLITRIDFGCCIAGKKFFVNEIEFNPGLYLHADGPRRFNFDHKLSKQLGKVFEHYNKKQQ